MSSNRAAIAGVIAVIVLAGVITGVASLGRRPAAQVAADTRTPVRQTPEPFPSPSTTPALALEPTATARAKSELIEPTGMPPAHRPGDAGAPYPGAPPCPDIADAHDNHLFHALWDSARGCHYNHEHGQDPFAPQVAAAFPGFDLWTLIGSVGVGHSNPSSPMENTHKHGGFKWDVTLTHSGGCVGGEGATVGVDAAVIEYHNFGDYSVEFETRTHTALGLMRQCLENDPTDHGYLFVIQLQDYGQRVVPYQGSVMPYPDAPAPAYNSARKPYFTIECFGSAAPCDKYPTRQYLLNEGLPADSLWVSQPNGNMDESGSNLFALLFRVRDIYQILDGDDLVYPFSFRWLCSADDGLTYDPTGCRYNNTTSRVHQVAGEIPAGWDNLAGFDTDARPGRITAEGFVTRFGVLNRTCTEPSADCYPLKLEQAFVGTYGSLFYNKQEINSPLSQPERDIYFCGEQVCAEGDGGAVPSGWLGPMN